MDDMTEKAELEKKENGWTPKRYGWYILHASKAPWVRSERFGIVCDFEGDGPYRPR